MNKSQKTIIDLLCASMNRRKISYSKKDNINWKKVINEAREHQISSLIYYSIDKSSFQYIEKDLFEEWKREVLISNMIQVQHIQNISKVISDLKELGIEIIVLKGLVVREFYPKPEFRSMCDADILIRSEDYIMVKDYLLNQGYSCNKDKNSIHQGFTCADKLEIEIHWKLVNEEYLDGNVNSFEENAWNDASLMQFYGITTYMLCLEDFIIHLCIHMAVHIKYKGFGLRQLYDLAIVIKNKQEEIDWTKITNRLSNYGTLKFAKGMFILINEIFYLNIPKNILNDATINKEYIKILLNNIINSGVYGKREEIKGLEELYEFRNNENYLESNTKKILKLIFPSKKNLDNRYKYAKKNGLLIPIAWIHRAITGIFIKKYGLIKMIKYIKKLIELRRRKIFIIKTFEL